MNRFFWVGIEIACGLLFLLLLASFPVLERGSATYVVWWLAAGHLTFAMTIIGGFIYFDWDPFDAIMNR